MSPTRVIPRLASLVLPLLLMGCRDGAHAPGGSVLLKLSHITAPNSPWDRGAAKFAELLSAASGGKITVRVFPGARLAMSSQETELQMLCGGSIDMTLNSTIILALYVDRRFDAFSLPWLLADHAQADALCQGPFGDEALGWLTPYDIVGLAWGANGFRQLTNARRPVRSPADLAGLKIRVAGSDIFRETFAELGAQPLTMNFGEVLTALQQGVIDGQENPLGIIETSRLYECQKYLTIWDYTYDPLILTMNAKRWASFSPEEQAMIRRCAAEAMTYQRKIVARDDRTIPDQLARQGMQIVRLTPAERAAFQAKVRSIYTKFRSKIGPETLDGIVRAAAAPSTASAPSTAAGGKE